MHIQFPCSATLLKDLQAHPALDQIEEMEPTLIQEITQHFQDKFFPEDNIKAEVLSVIAAHTCDWWRGCKGKHLDANGYTKWDFFQIRDAIASVLEEIARKG